MHADPQSTPLVGKDVEQIVDSTAGRETWLRQSLTFVRAADGGWRVAMGQGTMMYQGPPLDPAMHARYAGSYVLADGRMLQLDWEDGTLMAALPNGTRTQIFLASPTEEAVRTPGGDRLRFMLDADGRPVAAAMIRVGAEVWRAARKPKE